VEFQNIISFFIRKIDLLFLIVGLYFVFIIRFVELDRLNGCECLWEDII
jgi:hypothetical protein